MDVTIRTITVGCGTPHPLDEAAASRASAFLRQAQEAAEQAGYTVQTTRLSTHPVLEDMANRDDAALESYARDLQQLLDAHGIGFCSLGPAPASAPNFPVSRIGVLPRLLLPNAALSASVQLATPQHGVNYLAARPTAEAMRALASGDGEANFRFAALAMCEPGGPFFPQAFHRGTDWTVSVGLQSASLVRQALADLVARVGAGDAVLGEIVPTVRTALTEAATPVVQLLQSLAGEAGFTFSGIDLSPAPLGDESIVDAFEALGLGEFGGPGTLAIAAALTTAIHGVELPTCGYCGLMLPVLEDRVLGERCAEGRASIPALLAYSSVCGTGLDTIPLPGDAPIEQVAALLADVAALAHRLAKPLAARLFLVPGGHASEMTHFTSPYLTNTRIMSL